MKKSNTATKQDNQQEAKNFEVKVKRAHVFNDTRTGFDAYVNGVDIKGFAFVEGSKGDFISMPSEKGKDGEYYNKVWFPTSDEMIADVKKQIEAII